MWTAGSAKSTSAETVSSCSEPVSLGELLLGVVRMVAFSGFRSIAMINLAGV